MAKFGETIRKLREAQGLGLRETANLIDISPTYLSRIEREKESPPKPEIIKSLAKVLAADPDVLFRLCPSTDPEIVTFLKKRPQVMAIVRLVMEKELSDRHLDLIYQLIERDLVTEIDLTEGKRKTLLK